MDKELLTLIESAGFPDAETLEQIRWEQRNRYGYLPITYICSPYSGDTAANQQLARDLCLAAVADGRIPLAPHLLFPQFTDDTDPGQRELAMYMNRVLITKSDDLWVYAPRVSAGMWDEIAFARHYGTPIKFLDQHFQEIN